MPRFRKRAQLYSVNRYAFLYVVVGKVNMQGESCSEANWKVTEFGMGSYPYAPDDWPERELVLLAEAALSDLDRHVE